MPPMTLDKAIYWELRTKMLEHQVRVKEFEAHLAVLFQRAGLTLGTDYRLDDATCSASPVASEQMVQTTSAPVAK